MLFNSYQFIFVFLPVALAGCFLLAKFAGQYAAQIWLICISVIFYACWTFQYLPLLLASIAGNYIFARLIIQASTKLTKKRLLILAVFVNLALLGYYKYWGFAIGVVYSTIGVSASVPAILLPLGISFYTFQQLTLLADLTKGPRGVLRLRHFILFVIFFPHLIAGPIVHHGEMMPQFEQATFSFKWSNFAVGITLFAMGLFKKAVLADGIAAYVTPLYASAGSGERLTLFYAWAAAMGFMLELYFDFSGYSEMASGLARMVGIKLPLNFNSPLKATSITEHWSRWHMTLTRFLTEYVYTPMTMALTRRRKIKGKSGLGGSTCAVGAFTSLLLLPSICTMFIAGLWHGAGFQFLVWGTLHGLYISANQGWRLVIPSIWRDVNSYNKVMGPIGFLLTFVAVVGAIPFFRADSVETALRVVGGMFLLNGVTVPDVIANRLPEVGAVMAAAGINFVPASITILALTWLWIGALLAIALMAPNVMEILTHYDPVTKPLPRRSVSGWGPKWLGKLLVWRPERRWAIATAGIAACGILALSRAGTFLYWQF